MPRTGRPRTPLFLRFAEKVSVADGCWEWLGGRWSNGYGKIREGGVHGRDLLAHRVSYQALVGEIPAGLVLDHLCSNRGCVRPDHLEPVTQGVNSLRGNGPAAMNARMTECALGHPLSGENLRIEYSGARRCLTCLTAEWARARAARKLRLRKVPA